MNNKIISGLVYTAICLLAISTSKIQSFDTNNIKQMKLDDNTYITKNGNDYQVNEIGTSGFNPSSIDSLHINNSIKRNAIYAPTVLEKLRNEGVLLELSSTCFEKIERNNLQDLAYEVGRQNIAISSDELPSRIQSTNLEETLNIQDIINFKDNVSQYYRLNQNIYLSYSFGLSVDYSSLSSDESNFTTSFISDLNAAYSSSNFDNLFNKYGSYIITEGSYGSVFYSSVSISTNKILLPTSIENTSDLNTTLSDNELRFSLETSQGTKYDVPKDIDDNTFSDLYKSKINEWSDYLKNHKEYKLISVDNSLPLWDVIPSSYNKELMKNAFINYYNNDKTSYESTAKKENQLSFTSSTFASGKNGLKIKFDNQFGLYILGLKISSNPYIEMNLTKEFGYGYDVLLQEGFKSINVSLEMDIKECNDGYQHFYLYEGYFVKGQPPLKKYIYEHTPNKCDKKWKEISGSSRIDMGTYNLEDLTNLKRNNKLYIGFGSGGNFENDWRFRNLKVIIQVSK